MITSRMTPAMIHPRTRKPRRRRGTVGTRIGCEAYCRGTDVPGRAIRRSLGAARFVGDGEQAPTTGVRGRELLAGREALPAPCGLERVVVRVGALTLLGRDPTKPSALGRGVVHPARVYGREQIPDAVVELLALPFPIARTDAVGDHVGVGVVAERFVDGGEQSIAEGRDEHLDHAGDHALRGAADLLAIRLRGRPRRDVGL